ncbi:MAG: hypothetical protein FWG21_06515 [Oscillospiraceae bacterium]|nr:hypothetical protein [Oscillospiraceae bacterium]
MYILCDGTGVPGRKAELIGASDKQTDGSDKTCYVILVVFMNDMEPFLNYKSLSRHWRHVND